MIRVLLLACALQVLVFGTVQAQPLPPDLAAVPEEIKSLPWQGVDLSAQTPLQQCRALLFLNHALDEVSATATSEADLMSAYIQQQAMGGDFVKVPPSSDLTALSFEDCEKIAIALLQGPMNASSYATGLTDMSADELSAYQQMYSRTCQRRWSEVQEARHQVRNMSAFLKSANKMPEYQTWATAEVAKRQEAYQEQLANQKASAEAAAAEQAAQNQEIADEQTSQLQHQNEQLQQALTAAQYQQQQQADLAQAQGQSQQPPQPTYDVNYDGYYPPPYYGVNTAWCYDAAYNNQSRAATEARMAGWHGVPAGRGIGRR